ncbi:DUF4249 domain-containing protein [Polaribacter porphyrae]|uniref:DUF4249 domain-containing protein n=1 Tax=Polaribacter porphyrae TaxID=1137780 RepID=A0A2S7WPM4_9FLAO|nr:DUF4249 domain-containing protein [Polaribacter porphyrae]PQJ79272.1 hypothetical protein BTO18_08845 [Polaribacter porphyrae]
MIKNKIILLIIILITFSACETVINLDFEDDQERLVIEALIKWQKGTSGNNQTIKLSKTASFYDNSILPAKNADVKISNQNGAVFVFNEIADGIYETNNFIPSVNESYTLTIVYENEVYVASETLIEAPDINNITQTIENGDSTTEPEINVFFDDKPNIENFYRIIYERSENNGASIDSDYTIYDDQFEDGNELVDFNEYEEIAINQVFQISLFGISERFSNYLSLINAQGDAGFDPFASPPVNVFGNCVNTTNSENYPYGYFGLSEFDVATYTWQ